MIVTNTKQKENCLKLILEQEYLIHQLLDNFQEKCKEQDKIATTMLQKLN